MSRVLGLGQIIMTPFLYKQLAILLQVFGDSSFRRRTGCHGYWLVLICPVATRACTFAWYFLWVLSIIVQSVSVRQGDLINLS